MTSTEQDTLKLEIDEMVPDMVALRRDLHQHPELAFEEVRTSEIVAGRLRALGLEVQTGIARTGVVGLLRGTAGEGGRTLAIRADMDALPIHELNEVDYRSTVDGKMHACGHDGHVSIALAVAALLSRHRDRLKGTVKFVFQPAEEVIGGAAPMVQAGVMEGVDGVIGLHLFSGHPVGRVGVRSGPIFAAADRLELRVKGKGGHAAMPEGTIDPVVIASQIILALQTLISRETSPFERAVLTIASVHAGSAFNIIPEEAVLQGTLRTFDEGHRQRLIERLREMAQGIAAAHRGSCEVEVADGCLACVNDPLVTEVVRQAAEAAVGPERVDSDERVMTTGSDDMAYFLHAVPGCYFIVGARNEAKGAVYPHHHPHFNIDEEALPVAVEVLTRTALDYLHP
ncbi:M20 metallopeptidase family protein [Thermogemmatispora onikobensis]|uniref:M20 metallopeptidase family protein n=1 Tax=Thermogemmatispora onikobensis TaxID=732234 RepID=UPI000853191F|nr:amidohydrolase [Thermogemmatispora onikobensis]